jgi:hypothetical protein
MARARAIKKMTLPVADLRAMSDDHRYAILLLGLLSNEANWLRKLLVKAVLGITEGVEPDGQANFALTALLATTLVGKIHEGWDRVATGRLGKILDGIGLPAEMGQLHTQIDTAVKGKLFLKIRNGLAFHYPDRKFDFRKLTNHLDDLDTVIYMAPEGYQGDVFSQISSLAGIEPLVALHPSNDYRVALKAVWEEVTNITGMYCIFITEALATVLLKSAPGLIVDDVVIADAPEADEYPLRFFVHPPSELEQMRELLNAQEGAVLHARPLSGEIDYAELSREHIARYPKIRARLAE